MSFHCEFESLTSKAEIPNSLFDEFTFQTVTRRMRAF